MIPSFSTGPPFSGCTPPKTKMTMEKQPFQVACPMKDGDFSVNKKPDVPIALVAENFGEKTHKFPKTTSKEPELPAGEQ